MVDQGKNLGRYAIPSLKPELFLAVAAARGTEVLVSCPLKAGICGAGARLLVLQGKGSSCRRRRLHPAGLTHHRQTTAREIGSTHLISSCSRFARPHLTSSQVYLIFHRLAYPLPCPAPLQLHGTPILSRNRICICILRLRLLLQPPETWQSPDPLPADFDKKRHVMHRFA